MAAEFPSHATNVQPAQGWSKPLNESWPPPETARRLNDVELEKQIPVVVRLVFDTGEELLPGVAARWVPGKHVYVRVNDARLHSGGVWVDPADARPVDPQSGVNALS